MEAFLESAIPFSAIPRTIEAVLEATTESHPVTIQEVLALDREAREAAERAVRVSAP